MSKAKNHYDVASKTIKLIQKYILEAKQSKPIRKKMDMSIPADIKDIHQSFVSAGYELYIVGGAVRDTLLNKQPEDYDLATDANPDVVQDILRSNPDNKVDLTGKAFGVVRVRTHAGEEYEVATFRRDVGKGRRPDSVEFTTIEDDVNRRDLTINALFYDLNTDEVVDYIGGMKDIESGTIRAVGNPVERFQEDKLRILRAVRFAGRLGSDLDPVTRQAILSDNDLTDVSPERIRDEVVKGITSSKNPSHFLIMLDDLQLYSQILPGLSIKSNTASSFNSVVVQLALLLTENNYEQAKSVLKSMKYSNDEVAGIVFLLKFLSIDKTTAPGMKKEFNRIKIDSASLAEFAGASEVSPKVLKAFLSFAEASPAINPQDLIAKGLKGQEIGLAMQDAESDEYDKMLEELRKYIRNSILIEVTKLPKRYFSEIDNAVISSKFWERSNLLDDIDYSETQSVLATPAADALHKALQQVFEKLELDISILVRSHDTDNEDMMLHPGHPAYPNRWLIDASWYVSKENLGKNTIDIEIMAAREPITDFNSATLVRHITQTIRHELVHYSQMKKQGKNKNLSDAAAFEEMLNDPRQIPDSKEGTVQDYLRSHIEIDAHAHDTAEELLAVYGKDGALDIIRGSVDLSDPKLPNALQHYYEILPTDDKTIKKLHGKIFKYIEHFSQN